MISTKTNCDDASLIIVVFLLLCFRCYFIYWALGSNLLSNHARVLLPKYSKRFLNAKILNPVASELAVGAETKNCSSHAPPAESLSDDLLLWLSEELSQKETALLVSSLCLRRSVAQMVKLRAGDSPSAQAFHILAMWRRALPAIQHQPKASQLAQCLAQSGRPDLARAVLLRQADLAEMRKLKK